LLRRSHKNFDLHGDKIHTQYYQLVSMVRSRKTILFFGMLCAKFAVVISHALVSDSTASFLQSVCLLLKPKEDIEVT
jgi:hypothetical protein